MSLQDNLEQAILLVQTDAAILNTIIHGDIATTVQTNNGEVDSPAKAVHEIKTTIESSLTDLGATATLLNQSITQAELHELNARSYAELALSYTQALNLPDNLQGQSGKLLAVNAQEDGYEVIDSQSIFYGLRLDGSELLCETGDANFIEDDFATWTITLPGVDFTINDHGHLIMTF